MIVGHTVEKSWNKGGILSSSFTMVFVDLMDQQKSKLALI